MFGTIKLRKSDKLWRTYLCKKRGCRSDVTGRIYPDCHGLQVSHFFTRGRESVRFDLENTDLISVGEHLNFHKNPALYAEFKRKKLGEKKYKMLMVRANSYCKKDEKLACLYIKKLIEEIR